MLLEHQALFMRASNLVGSSALGFGQHVGVEPVALGDLALKLPALLSHLFAQSPALDKPPQASGADQ
ncbi:hypothetical protein DNK10_10600 [Pseudomonas daroniae]|nr:hypothetical protein DNK10_10600 [Pseudomonas daroniae]